MLKFRPCRNAVDGVKGIPGIAKDKKTGVAGALPNIKADGVGDRSGAGNASLTANDSFNKHYNKELKVSEGKSKPLSLALVLI